MRLFFFVFLFFNLSNIRSQTITKYFDYNWKQTDIAHARFAGIIKHTDSGWTRVDYFLNEDQYPQMIGKYADSACKISDGYFKYFHANQVLHMKGKYVNNKKEGLWLSYHNNGMMEDSSFYENGGKRGISKSWYKNGFTKDSISVQPEFATVVSWFDNGNLSSAGRYNNKDKPIGAWQFFHKNGQLASKEKYDVYGNLVSKTYYDESGQETDTTNKDKAPEFPGGIKKWISYLEGKLVFPHNYEIVNSDVAVVTVDFVINEEGSIEDVTIVTPFFKVFNESAIDIFKKAPKWKPEINHNRKVKSYQRQSVIFQQKDY